jgi:hypothetical protein
MDTFADLVEWDVRYNKMPPVEITGVDEKSKSLRIYFIGGNNVTDGYASFVRNLSYRVCEQCGVTDCGCT